jgi:hypothetical protein
VPQMTYVVSLDRARIVDVKPQPFSIHKMAPEVFGGFETIDSGAYVATAEKALFDVFYLSGTRTHFFASLPELEFPEVFDFKEMDRWADRIPVGHMRARVASKISEAKKSFG